MDRKYTKNEYRKAELVASNGVQDAVLIDPRQWIKIVSMTPQQAKKYTRTQEYRDLPATVQNYIGNQKLGKACACPDCQPKDKEMKQ